MSQEQFINMWRTVYSFFAFETNQEIFTSLSRVGKYEGRGGRERHTDRQTDILIVRETDRHIDRQRVLDVVRKLEKVCVCLRITRRDIKYFHPSSFSSLFFIFCITIRINTT